MKTYANVAAPGGSSDKSELLMDEDDAEEAAKGLQDQDTPVTEPDKPPESVENLNARGGVAQKCSSEFPPLPDASAKGGGNAPASATWDTPAESVEIMDTSLDASKLRTSNSVAKRPHGSNEEGERENEAAASGEPPPKSTVARRPSFKPKPNVPPDRRQLNEATT